jgi:hypothetical protein
LIPDLLGSALVSIPQLPSAVADAAILAPTALDPVAALNPVAALDPGVVLDPGPLSDLGAVFDAGALSGALPDVSPLFGLGLDLGGVLLSLVP